MAFYPNDPERENLIQLLQSPDPVNRELGLAIDSANTVDLSEYWYDRAVLCALGRCTMGYFDFGIEKETRYKKDFLNNYLSRSVQYILQLHTANKHNLQLFLPEKKWSAFEYFGEKTFPKGYFVRPENPFLSEVHKLHLKWGNSPALPDLSWLRAFPALRELKISDYPQSQLPEGLNFLYPQLEQLDLSGLPLESLPDALAQAKSLKTLYLDQTKLKELPLVLAGAKNLKKLYISGLALETLPDFLLQFKQLEVLDIKNNAINSLPTALPKLKALKRIELYGNPIQNWDMVFKQLRLLPNLKMLSWFSPKILKTGNFFNYHKIKIDNEPERTQPNWSDFFNALKHFSGLRDLQISRCKLKELPPNAMPALRHLERLHLQGNKLKSLDLEGFTQLKNLNLSENELTQIPNFVKSCKGLESLSLSHNALGEIPEWLAELQTLTNLHFNHTKIKKLPDNIFSLKKMLILEVEGNELTEISAQIKELRQLRQLNLNKNKLRQIPDNIGYLEHLTHLRVSHNHLQTLAETIVALPQLHTINTDFNSDMDWVQAMKIIANVKKITYFSWMQGHQMSTWNFRNQQLYLYGGTTVNDYNIALSALAVFSDTEKIELRYAEFKQPFTAFALFPKLKELKFFSCKNIEFLWQAPILANLERLEIDSCNLYEISAYIGLLPKLNWLKLSNNHIKTLPEFLLKIQHPLTIELSHMKLDAVPEAFKNHPFISLKI